VSGDESSGQTIAAIERAVDVLLLFGEPKVTDLGVTEIAARRGLSKAVVHRILSSFRASGFVEVDESSRRYRLGPAALRLGLAYLDRVDVRDMARPELEGLVAATDETATLSIRSGWQRIYLDQVTPPRDVKMVVQLGQSVPLHAGASSKAFLAFLPADEQREYVDTQPLDALSSQTITGKRKLRRELDAVVAAGYARSRAERLDGAASVAAPVFGHDGLPAAVVSVCGPLERFTEAEAEAVTPLLLAATARLSDRLGYRDT
jgi:DNA-binding IclR family transcriptional regulator